MTTATGNMLEWMSRSRRVLQVRSQASTEGGLNSVPSIPASAELGDELDGVSENTTTITNFETAYVRSWRRIESDSDASLVEDLDLEDLDLEVVDGGDHDYGNLTENQTTISCEDANYER